MKNKNKKIDKKTDLIFKKLKIQENKIIQIGWIY